MKVFERATTLIDYTITITENTDRFPKKTRFPYVFNGDWKSNTENKNQ